MTNQHTFTITLEKGSGGRWISEFEASLVYRVSSKTARATQRNPVSKKKQKKKRKKQNKETKKCQPRYQHIGVWGFVLF